MLKNIYLTVNEFAKLHNVNKRTLHYYDSIGIFQPKKVGENSYRYYTYTQGAEFEMILALRELGMSIDEIREYQKTRSVDALNRLLMEKSEDIDQKIKQLKELKQILNKKRENLLLSQSDQVNRIDVIECKQEYLLLTDIGQLKSEENMDEQIYASLAEYRQQEKSIRAFNSSYGSMLASSCLLTGEFSRYQYLFVTITKPKNKKGLYVKPAGTYIRAFCKGDWSGIEETYRRIVQYAGENGWRLIGYSYEECINEMGIPAENAADRYVTQITVQCEQEK